MNSLVEKRLTQMDSAEIVKKPERKLSPELVQPEQTEIKRYRFKERKLDSTEITSESLDALHMDNTEEEFYISNLDMDNPTLNYKLLNDEIDILDYEKFEFKEYDPSTSISSLETLHT